MTDVTLSKAVRANLLHLQNTAKMMDRTQERLATGLKVNSALDNPTNFFTASALKARSKDLDLLMDAISNGVQTLQAADKGISAISKLVEAAQATARQALQTTPTVQQPVRQAGSVTTVNLSALTIAGAQPAQPATIATANLTGFTAAAAQPPGPAEGTVDLGAAGNATAMTNGFADGTTLSFTDGTDTYTIYFHDNDSGAVTPPEIGIDVSGGKDIDTVLSEIQAAIAGNADGFNDFTIAMSGTDVVFSMGTNLDDTLTVAGTSGAATAMAGAYAPDPGAPATTGSFTINGHTVTIAPGDGLTEVMAAFQAAEAASGGTTAFTVSESGGVITVEAVGTNSLVIAGDNTAVNAVGLSSGTVNQTPAVASQAGTITINGVDVAIDVGDQAGDILAKLQAAAATSAGTNQFTVTGNGGFITIEGVGSNSVQIGGTAATLQATGLTAGNHLGAPTGTTVEVVNPKRREMVTQYNELLQQISDMTKDASFNGVNLINGDNLEVLFNEDGTSRLVIQGVAFDALNLNLLELPADGFDATVDIESTLSTLKDALGTLRTQASRFGANLTVVEARQNFTKQMINTLESGAANLTLADTNEEAANMLALQTRQQLSQTALSLASQADQSVLRLFG
ncbi:flagellin [Pelagibacterium limicola]|uniref:flagellin N-terminal helical domain-containing protein n=1 Tax=Pelagibacterium limicola TaxID=2791022 RepID=UPI0018AFB462|nr:flagellin [Pelagibacterium limicola]